MTYRSRATKCHDVINSIAHFFGRGNFLNTHLIALQINEMRPLFMVGQMRPDSSSSQ